MKSQMRVNVISHENNESLLVTVRLIGMYTDLMQQNEAGVRVIERESNEKLSTIVQNCKWFHWTEYLG